MNKMLYSFTMEEKTTQIYTHLLYEDIEDSYLHNGLYRSVSTLSIDELQNIIQSELNSLDVTQLIEQCALLNMWGQALPFKESRIASMNILRNLKFPVDRWDNTKVLLHRDMLLYLIGAATVGSHEGKIKCAGARTYIGQRKMTVLFFLTNSLLSRLITQGQLPSHTKIDRLLFN